MESLIVVLFANSFAIGRVSNWNKLNMFIKSNVSVFSVSPLSDNDNLEDQDEDDWSLTSTFVHMVD